MININHISLLSMLAYLQDVHGLDAYDLDEREVNTKNKADVKELIESYGWAQDCFDYNN